MAKAESLRGATGSSQGNTRHEAPSCCRLLGGPKAPARRRAASRSLIRNLGLGDAFRGRGVLHRVHTKGLPLRTIKIRSRRSSNRSRPTSMAPKMGALNSLAYFTGVVGRNVPERSRE